MAVKIGDESTSADFRQLRIDPIVVGKLRQLRRRRFGLLLLRGLCAAIVAFVLVFSLVALADWLWLLDDAVRWGLSAGAYFLVVVAVWGSSLRRLVKRPAVDDLAAHVEQIEPELRENLLSALELATDNPVAIHDSPVFRSLLQGQVARLMATVKVPRLLPLRLVTPWLLAALMLAAISAVLLFSGNSRVRQLVARAVLPGANIARVSRVRIEILEPTPHSLTLAADETVAVVVDVTGGKFGEVVLETSTQKQGSVRQRMYGRSEREFAANIHVAEQAVEYRILAGDAITERFFIDSQPRPQVKQFFKTYHYPAYAQLSDLKVAEEQGDLVGLQGSTVDVVVELDQEVSTAELRIDRADAEQLQIVPMVAVPPAGPTADAADKQGVLWSANVPLDQAGVYKVHLVSLETGFENPYSPKYEIRPLPDLIPRGFVDQQETTLLLPPNDIVALKAMAEDDLPLVRLEQGISVNGREWELRSLNTISVGESEGRQVESAWQWDLLDHQLKTGDQILTKLVATDRMGNVGESIPLRIVVAAQDFNPERHATMLRKTALYDDLADFSARVHEQLESALELIARMRQEGQGDEAMALDRSTLLDLAARQRTQAAKLLEKIIAVERDMPPGADAYDLELTGRVISRIQLEHANTPIYLLHQIESGTDREKVVAGLEQLKSTFERSADDAKHVAEHYKWLATHNYLDALAIDFDALLKQQSLIVDSPTQTWERLQRQETVAVSQLRDLERLIREQRTRIPDSIDQNLVGVLRWVEDQRVRLEDSLESEDKLAQLRQVSQDVLARLKERQRIESLDGGLPTRLIGIRKDFENRSGSLYVPLDELARSLQQETRLTVQASTSKDSVEIDRLVRESQRYGAEVTLKHTARLGQFASRRELTQNRRDGDTRYAADAGLTSRAVRALLNQHTESPPVESTAAESLLEVAPAYRVLEAGHQLILARDSVNVLLTMERWSNQSLEAHIDHPRQWDVVQQTLELASQSLRGAKIDDALVGRLDGIRWSAAVRDAGRKISERRWKRDLMVNAAYELTDIRDQLGVIVDDLQPAMDQARTVIARYAPTIPEIARQAAEQIREMEQATTETADLAEQQEASLEDFRLEGLQRNQQEANQQIEDLFEALVEDANAQDLLDDQQRERARDADDSIALVEDPATEMNRALQRAEQAEGGEQQARELSQAAEQQERAAQALDLVAEHFERLEQGMEVADSREALRQSEREQGIGREMDQQFQPAEQLAQLANQPAEQLLAELEAELKRNPAMQQALSEIARNTLADARDSLEFSAQEEQNLQRGNERSDEEYQAKKRELAEDLRELANAAAELSQTMVAQAHQAAEIGQTQEAHRHFAASQQELQEAATRARAAREEQLLSELSRTAEATRSSLRKATELLREAKQETGRGKDEQVHADPQARDAAQKSAEQSREQFFEQQKRVARDQTRRADETQRRAGQSVNRAQTQLNLAQKRLERAQRNAAAKPDDNGLKQQVAQQEAQLAAERQKMATAQQELGRAKAQAELKAMQFVELERKPMPALTAPNPSTQLADGYAEDAIKIAEELNRQADQLADRAQFENELTPSPGQLASAREQQENLTEDVTNVAADVERAGRHERRLDNAQAAESLNAIAGEIFDVARNEATDAERQLSQATEESQQAEKAATENRPSPGNAETLEAQQALAVSEAALARQAQSLDSVLTPLDAEAASAQGESGESAADATADAPPSGNGDESAATPGMSGTGSDTTPPATGSAPSLTPEEMARGQQLARTLDELDRSQAAANQAAIADLQGPATANSNTTTPAQLGVMAQAARAQQAQMAAARQRSQQQAMATMTQNAQQSAPQNTDAFSDPEMASEFAVTDVNRNEEQDWGKLRSQSAENLTRGRGDAVAEEYRQSVEAYFRVLAERARKGK